MILANMRFRWFEAAGLFILWSTQIYFQYQASQISLPNVYDPGMLKPIWDILHIRILEFYNIIYWVWIIAELAVILAYYRKMPFLRSLKIAWASRS
jgi:hypothetical protein